MEALRGQDANANIYQQRPRDKLEVEELSRGLKVRSDKPHLVSLGGGRLSTAVTLLPLDEGITNIGSAANQDICITGAEVKPEHCYIENQQATLTLCPLNKALITVDGERVLNTVQLTQGCMLCLGRANYFRFNHPEQAMRLKGTGPLSPCSDHEEAASYQHTLNGEVFTKGHTSLSSSSEGTRDSYCSAESGDGSLSPYRDNLADQSFKNKLKRFEHLSTSQVEDNAIMSPPLQSNNFSYHNYVGEKLFTKDTNTTRLSVEPVSCESFTRRKSVTHNESSGQLKPPKPDTKPKPTPKPKPRLEPSRSNGSSSSGMPGSHSDRRAEFKTLSMISTETSIWGSTSSAGTVRLDDDLQSPISCHTPTDDLLDHPDVFTDEMTASLTMKHQQMVEERKLEEDMERKEQERLEEILAMCAQYEQQIDSESKLNVDLQSPTFPKTPNQQSPPPVNQSRNSPPKSLPGLTTPYLGNFTADRLHVTTSSSQNMPDVLSDSIHSVMSSSSSSYSDRKNIKTNGSLIQSPTSPHSGGVGNSVFTYNNNKILSTTNPTYIHTTQPAIDAYKDDERLYDCPADIDIRPETSEATTGKPMVLNSSMTASIYADDERIYDRPADIIMIPPPVPAHNGTGRKSASSDVSDASTHRKTDSSSSSDLTVVSSAASFRTAIPELPVSNHAENNKTEDIFSHLDSLKTKRAGILEKLTLIKQKIMEVESQQTEAVRELEMEQALLQGEQQTELNALQRQWEESDMLKSKRLMVMNNYAKQQEERLQKIEDAREKLQRMEQRRVEIEEELRIAPDDDKDELLAQYEVELDALENQKKIFEDLEFQQLEMEAKFEEETEAVQRELNNKQGDLVSKIKRAEDNLAHMTKQQTDMMDQTRHELDDMERQRKILVAEFQREKEKMMSLDHKMKDARKQYGSNGLSTSQYSYCQDQDDMILQSPAATLNKSLIARLKPGDILMEEERRRLESLKHAATEASIIQWHEQRSLENNLRRFGTLDSEEENLSTRSSETPSDADKISYNSSMDDQDRFSELQMLLAQARHHVQNAENTDLVMERKLRAKLEIQLAEEKSKREELVEQEVRLRDKSTANPNMRPLTRYLPVRETEFDLKSHVESTGHNLGSCPFVEVTPTQCKGYLLKMGTKVKTWNKRWFVFDREKKALLYYSDKSESKPRGGIYFQSIEDVFVDHMRTVKSPNQKFTFCVKTYDKPYYLVAKSPEALSIWIDVIFTGAEGYQEF